MSPAPVVDHLRALNAESVCDLLRSDEILGVNASPHDGDGNSVASRGRSQEGSTM